MDFPILQAARHRRWGQTPETRVPDPDAAITFLERVGIATLFPASPEIPDLYRAHMGDPGAQTDSSWDSPSGHVYSWRWALGKRAAAFYAALVRKKPTWVAWKILPAALRLFGDLRDPEEIYQAGEMSADAYRIARALAQAGGVLTTGDLRREAGFPTGKEQRAAYLKAVEELDTRLLLAKVFSPEEGDLNMSHALVAVRHANAAKEAAALTREAALERFLHVYLPNAAYAIPAVLAKHLGLPESELRAGLERLAASGAARSADLPGVKGACFVCNESHAASA